jgi:hypothetical protein
MHSLPVSRADFYAVTCIFPIASPRNAWHILVINKGDRQMNFSQLTFKPRRSFPGGVQAKVFFANGYGASVICGPETYGNKDGLYELAVLRGTEADWKLCYDTPITDDVLGWQTEEDISDVLGKIEALPAA